MPEVTLAARPVVVAESAGEQGAKRPEGGAGKHARSAASYPETTSYAEATAYVTSAPRSEAEAAALEARADEMLAMLAAESSHPMGPLAARLESTGSRVMVGVVGLVLLSAAGLLVMTVLGHFM